MKAQAADFYYPSSDGCIQSGGELCDLKQVQRPPLWLYVRYPTGWLSDIDDDSSSLGIKSTGSGSPIGNMSDHYRTPPRCSSPLIAVWRS